MTTEALAEPLKDRSTAVARAVHDWIDRFPRLGPTLIYVLFAALVYVAQGTEPPLSIDHIAYFKLADEIRAEFPKGDYWHTFSSVRAYGVLLAYMYGFTASHVVSLKLILAVLTVAYLWSFQCFMGLLTTSRPRAVFFSLLSALFVSFGASIWGMTDFSASLNRTLVIPFVVLLVWFFFRFFGRAVRYAVYPALVLLSLLHLSALHVFLVFLAFEALDYVFRRRLRLTKDIAYFAAALVTSLALQGVIEYLSPGTFSFIRYTFNMAVPSVAQTIEAWTQPAPGKGAGRKAPTGYPSEWYEPRKAAPPKLSQDEAWKIELQAFPWRNFPPTLATILTIGSSYGVIFLLALWGVIRVFRRGAARTTDRVMVLFAFGVLGAAYGLQILLWALRNRVPVLPVNFEEIRAINMLMVPSLWFVARLYEDPPLVAGLSSRAMRTLIVLAFVLQPIVLVRALPSSWREGLISEAVARGAIRSSDAPRMLYARQFLGLADEGHRFYYSSRGALAWLKKNAKPGETVLTNLNEFYNSPVKAVGPFLDIVTMDVWDVRRAQWAAALVDIDDAMASHDIDRVIEIGRHVGATYAVVDWPVSDAVYSDAFYSIVRVNP
jgi:hypothetical protein